MGTGPEATDAVTWEELKREFDFSPEEVGMVDQRTAVLLSEAMVLSLSEVRERR